MLEGQWLLAGGRLAEAVPLLEKAVVADPDSFISRQLLTITWFSLGETGRAMESQYQVNQWLMVLAPDRDRSLEQLRARTYTDRLIDFDYRALDAYVYLMLHEWQSAIDNMAPYLADLDDFRHQCEMMCGKRYSPAISLATAYHALGDKAHFQDFLAIEQEAMNTRSENGRIHNTEYSRTFSRINVLQGRPYEAMLELERLVTTGPLDPRELMHPAFDILRDDPHFTRLEALQRSRVNAEREKLGLAPLPNGNSKGL